MSKKIKVVVALLALFFIGLISIVYFISTKIDPESIKERAVEAIEENLPGSKASIKEVSYNLGVSIKLNVKELEVSRKEGGRRLFYVKDVQVDVPVLAILTNGGTIDIKVLSPELVYEELPDNSSNWQKVFPDPAQTTGHKEEKAGRNGQEKKAIELPNFIDKSRMDLKITDLNLQYLPIGKKSANIMVNKILFKNLNLKKTTAYEVVSNIHYELDEEKVVKARMQLIGEVALNNLLQSGALDTNMLLNIEDASLSWLNIKFPALKNVIKFQMLKEGNIQAEIRTSA
ncbi:MAG: hypothetical protein WEB87_07160, partial [Bacteriovoracaceae bacterium]